MIDEKESESSLSRWSCCLSGTPGWGREEEARYERDLARHKLNLKRSNKVKVKSCFTVNFGWSFPGTLDDHDVIMNERPANRPYQNDH